MQWFRQPAVGSAVRHSGEVHRQVCERKIKMADARARGRTFAVAIDRAGSHTHTWCTHTHARSRKPPANHRPPPLQTSCEVFQDDMIKWLRLLVARAGLVRRQTRHGGRHFAKSRVQKKNGSMQDIFMFLAANTDISQGPPSCSAGPWWWCCAVWLWYLPS